MKELDELLTAHRVAQRDGEHCLLATLVKVDGSSYRRVGARMLMTSGGGRTGSISGGCLEAEIQKKAWWLTERGAVIQQYRTASENLLEMSGLESPYGLGCSGTLHVLLKRVDAESAALLESLDQMRRERTHTAMATALSGPLLGMQWLFSAGNGHLMLAETTVWNALERVAAHAKSEYLQMNEAEFFLEALPPRQKLIIFGAGDDAKPLVKFARLLGWDITVADGRSHLATTVRFPDATNVITAPATELPTRCAVQAEDAVVIMSHSFTQDEAVLRALIPQRLRYLGQLGPRKRTRELLASIDNGFRPQLAHRLHSPIGLDIGAHTPETIALAIIAEIQSVISNLNRAAVTTKKETGVSVPA